MRMLSGPLKWCTQGTLRTNLSAKNSDILYGIAGYQTRKKSSTKDVVHIEDKKVEVWPKQEPASPMWKVDCPKGPQPLNYDPYRIKIPNIAVPPLPPNNAKESPSDPKEILDASEIVWPKLNAEESDVVSSFPEVPPDTWIRSQKQLKVIKEVKLGYHGRSKYMYAFHEPWKPLDRMTLLAQAEDDENSRLETNK